MYIHIWDACYRHVGCTMEHVNIRQVARQDKVHVPMSEDHEGEREGGREGETEGRKEGGREEEKDTIYIVGTENFLGTQEQYR